MSRALSLAARTSIYAQETAETWLTLLTLTHPIGPTPIRIVNDMVDHVSRGNIFIGFPFELQLPNESDASPSQVILKIDATENRVMAVIRSLPSAPTVLMEVVLASSLDTVEVSFSFTMRDIEYDAKSVQARLFYEDFLNEEYPADAYTPANFPGIFGTPAV